MEATVGTEDEVEVDSFFGAGRRLIFSKCGEHAATGEVGASGHTMMAHASP